LVNLTSDYYLLFGAGCFEFDKQILQVRGEDCGDCVFDHVVVFYLQLGEGKRFLRVS
jgi:hypothetical protein